MKRIIIALILTTAFSVNLHAQVTEEEIFDQNLMFKDDYDHKDYPEALHRLVWILKNDPNPKENVFIKGVRVFEANMKLATDKQTKEDLQVQSINMLDQRLEIFGYNQKVHNQKLTKLYQYWAGRKHRFEEVMKEFGEAFEKNPEQFTNINLLAYMDMMRRVKKVGMEISNAKILNTYAQMIEILESRTDLDQDSDDYIVKIDGIFSEIPNLSCDDLRNIYQEKIQDDLEMVGYSKIYAKLGIKAGCQDEDLFHQALDYVIKYDPSLSLLLYKAKILMAQERFDESEQYFGRVLSYELDAEQRSDVFVSLAKIYTIKNDKTSARTYAFKAIKENNSKVAHGILGNLYMSSFSDCAEGKNIVERRAVFIAAYNEFQKAGDQENMALALASFPSSDEIHFNNYELGQDIEINCWFKETVSLEKRNN